MNATEVLYRARKHGAVFTLLGEDRVKVSAPLPLPGNLLADLKTRKADIIPLLGKVPNYSAQLVPMSDPLVEPGASGVGSAAFH